MTHVGQSGEDDVIVYEREMPTNEELLNFSAEQLVQALSQLTGEAVQEQVDTSAQPDVTTAERAEGHASDVLEPEPSEERLELVASIEVCASSLYDAWLNFLLGEQHVE